MNECIEFGCGGELTQVGLVGVSAGVDLPVIFLALFVALLVLTAVAIAIGASDE